MAPDRASPEEIEQKRRRRQPTKPAGGLIHDQSAAVHFEPSEFYFSEDIAEFGQAEVRSPELRWEVRSITQLKLSVNVVEYGLV